MPPSGCPPPMGAVRRIRRSTSRCLSKRCSKYRWMSCCDFTAIRFAHFPTAAGRQFYLEETELPDEEPFTLDNLSRYQFNSQLLNTLIDGDDPERLFLRVRAAGGLPYGAFGEIYWQKQQEEMSELAEQVRAERAESHSTGWISISPACASAAGCIRYRMTACCAGGPLRCRRWTAYCCGWSTVYCCAGGTGESRMYGRKIPHGALPRWRQKRHRRSWRNCWRAISAVWSQPLLLLNKSGWAWLSQCYLPETQEIDWEEEAQIKARAKLLQARQGDQRISGEGKIPTCSGCSANWIMNTWRKYWPKQSVICCRWRGITG